MDELTARFEGVEVPRPKHWGGFRLAPERVELWHNQADRLHDRLRYERIGDDWSIVRVAP